MRTRKGALVACVLLAGCGSGGSPKPRPIAGDAKEVASVVERLQTATARGDYATICNDILSASTRKQAGGAECPAVLGARARGVRHPRIAIRGIAVHDGNAQVSVRTTASGQAATDDVIRLVRENGSFRVVSLGR